MVGTHFEAGVPTHKNEEVSGELVEREYGFQDSGVEEPAKKSLCVAFLLWLPPFGLLGLHRAYVGHYYHAFWYFLTGGNLGLGWLFDLCRLSSMVKRASRNTPDKKLFTTWDSFALWLGPAGILGAHRGLCGMYIHQIFYFLTGGQFLMGWFIDLFLLCNITQRYNETKTNWDAPRRTLLDAYILQLPPAGLLGAARLYLGSGIGFAWFLTGGNAALGWLGDFIRLPFLFGEVKRRTELRQVDVESGSQARWENDNVLSKFDAFLLTLPPLGLLGAHKFYQGKWVQGILYFFTAGGFGVFWFIDLFTICCQVQRVNEERSMEIVLSNEVQEAIAPTLQQQQQQLHTVSPAAAMYVSASFVPPPPSAHPSPLIPASSKEASLKDADSMPVPVQLLAPSPSPFPYPPASYPQSFTFSGPPVHYTTPTTTI